MTGAPPVIGVGVGVGVEALCKAAGVSKRSMYQLFESKDELLAGAPGFKGCQYLAVQIELKDQSHPASRVAHRVKADLTGFFRDEATKGGPGDPDLLARQLSLVFDGASARAGIGADQLAGLVRPTVTTLLDAAGAR